MPSSLVNHIVKRTRRLFFDLREKEPPRVDESVLEHLLFYHGLVGSSPENQREFKDVRADINAAINSNSDTALSIALKLPPLWWTEKLTSIFSEISAEKRIATIALLAPSDEQKSESIVQRPLLHDDWRVRANAAFILALLKAQESSAQIAEALNDTAKSTTVAMAFCHIAYALGRLQTEAGHVALVQHASESESWFRVDAVGALAHYDFASVAHHLAKSLEAEWELRDYMSVAVSKKHSASAFLKTSDNKLQRGGAAMIIGILQAADQTFAASDIVSESSVLECLKDIIAQAQNQPSALTTMAAIKLIDWVLAKSPGQAILSSQTTNSLSAAELKVEREKIVRCYESADVIKNLEQKVAHCKNKSMAELSSLRYEITLAGLLRIKQTEPILTALLQSDFALLDEVVEALGLIGSESSVQALIALANATVNVQNRSDTPKSKQPVAEDNVAKARTYWGILKALGNFTSPECTSFLITASADFAPDKRAQAISSLVATFTKNKSTDTAAAVLATLKTGLLDRSTLVQMSALNGAAKLGAASLVADMAKLLDSRENNVSRQAYLALRELSKLGHSSAINEIISPKLKTEREEHKKRQIEQLLSSRAPGH